MRSFNSLNGWRRLGAVSVLAWVLACGALACYELQFSHGDMFTRTVIVESTFLSPHPDPFKPGFKPDTQEEREAKSKAVQFQVERASELNRLKREKLGRELDPWEMERVKKTAGYTVTNRIKVLELAPQSLLFSAVVLPVVVWLLVEGLVALMAWVRRGFSQS